MSLEPKGWNIKCYVENLTLFQNFKNLLQTKVKLSLFDK